MVGRVWDPHLQRELNHEDQGPEAGYTRDLGQNQAQMGKKKINEMFPNDILLYSLMGA